LARSKSFVSHPLSAVGDGAIIKYTIKFCYLTTVTIFVNYVIMSKNSSLAVNCNVHTNISMFPTSCGSDMYMVPKQIKVRSKLRRHLIRKYRL